MADLIDSYLSSYDYELDPQLIAQTPIEPRHQARLMVIGEENKDKELPGSHKVWDFKEELNAGDLLVLNDTRVLKARLSVRLSSGALGELFVLEPLGNGRWLCLGKPGRKMKVGGDLMLEAEENAPIELKLISKDNESGVQVIQFPEQYFDRGSIQHLLDVYGKIPLPPYIKRNESSDNDRYQTRYAVNPGAVAAPTAGLHFSDELLRALKEKGVLQERLTLHVGLGTFRPIKTENLNDLALHSEWVEIKEKVVKAIENCHSKGGRVFAVGTTCVRALEGAYQLGGKKLKAVNTKVDLVIKPGYQFGVIDGLLTNFHLPKSSLLLLVSALIGRKRLLKLYDKAISNKYRFYSYGDAMLIKPEAIMPLARSRNK